MKQIIALMVLVFLFFGCTPKQKVQLKMPNQQNSYVKPTKQAPLREDKKTVVQEVEPMDIIESDSKGKSTKKVEPIKEEEPVEYEVAPIMEGDKIENQPQSKPKGSSENQIVNPVENKIVDNKIEFDNKTIKMYDKVMHLQNRNMKTIDYSKFVQLNENDILDNYTIERKVMNGQVGIVLRVTSDVRNKLYVYYPLDDYVAIYTLSDVIKFKIIDLGYVMTVHKSQGSQYNRLLMPMVSRFSIMLNTQLLYTAVTRAKDMLTIIGEKRAFEEASTNISKNRRMTLLNNYQENN